MASNALKNSNSLILNKPRPVPPPIQSRLEILRSNPDLLKLHKELVGSKIITEEEFWEGRRHMLKTEQVKLEQSQGLSSSFLDNISPTSQGDGKKIYQITPEIIDYIFRTKPKVKKYYDEAVPTKYSEQEFWKKYFETIHFHRDRNKIDSVSVKKPSEDFMKITVDENPDEKQVIYSKKRKIDSTVDVSFNDDILENEASSDVRTNTNSNNSFLIRRILNHAKNVLDGNDSSEPPPKILKSIHFETTIPDLEERNMEDIVPLNIQNPQAYFKSSTELTNANVQLSLEECSDLLSSYSKEIANLRSRLNSQQQRNSLAAGCSQIILKEIEKTKSESSLRDEDGKRKFLEENEKKLVKNLFMRGTELLRHFWSGIRRKTSKEKLQAIIMKINALYEEIQKLPKEKNLSSSLIPLTRSLDKAIETKIV